MMSSQQPLRSMRSRSNAFGCLDNIAWIWVHEKDVKGKAGAELGLLEVGLGKKFVRKALTDNFRRLLDNRQKWLANLVNFRDFACASHPFVYSALCRPEAEPREI